jgi:hypothetical protein
MPLAASNILPDHAGYVAAAYLVFLALILIYVAIMAAKLGRIGREVAELDALAQRREAEAAAEPRREETHA